MIQVIVRNVLSGEFGGEMVDLGKTTKYKAFTAVLVYVKLSYCENKLACLWDNIILDIIKRAWLNWDLDGLFLVFRL